MERKTIRVSKNAARSGHRFRMANMVSITCIRHAHRIVFRRTFWKLAFWPTFRKSRLWPAILRMNFVS